jgi:hypothetical protein
MKTNSNKITKGIVFGGCSFTWGQGLYYYSNLETLKEPPPDCYDVKLVTDAHKRYGAMLRYPRLVANHFDTFEVCMLQNGGSEETTFMYIKRVLGIVDKHDHLFEEHFSFNEIEYIIIQTSQPNRNSFTFTFDGTKYDFRTYSPETREVFFKWLDQENIEFNDWYSDHVKNVFNQLKENMAFYESKGIKTLFLNWEDEYLPLIKKDSYMLERFIPLEYKGTTYECIRHLMNENKHLTINSDYEHFEIPPTDHHPSKECHEVMAANVIKKIEDNINNQNKIYGKKLI